MAEQVAFGQAAQKVGVSFSVFDHFLISGYPDPQSPTFDGWPWVKEALKSPQGDVCKTKVTQETTNKLPTFLHWCRVWKARDDLAISKYQVPPGWKKAESAGILDCEMSLLAEPPANLIQVAGSDEDKISAWGYCTIVHSLNSMLIAFKESNCPQPYNDLKELQIGIGWINKIIPNAEVAVRAKGMNFTFVKECGEQYKCNRE